MNVLVYRYEDISHDQVKELADRYYLDVLFDADSGTVVLTPGLKVVGYV